MFVPFQGGGQDYSKEIKLGYSFNMLAIFVAPLIDTYVSDTGV